MSSVQELHHGVLSVHQIILVSLVLANEHNEDLHSASALLLNHFLPHLQIKVAMSVDCAFKLLSSLFGVVIIQQSLEERHSRPLIAL